MVLAQSDDVDIEKILKRFVSRREGLVHRTDCPDEEALVHFLAGSLTGSRKLAVEEHLATCGACIDELVSFGKNARADAPEEVPPALITRVKGLVSETEPKRSFFDISVRLTETAIELVGTTGRWVDRVGAEPIAMRGRSSAEGGGLVIETEMGRFDVSVNVESAEPGACDVIVGVRDPGGEPVEGMRVGLYSDDRERASYLTRAGKVAFDGVARGKYTLPIRDDSVLVGTVRLDIA